MELSSVLRYVSGSLEEAINALAGQSLDEVEDGVQVAALFRCAAEVVAESPTVNLADQMEITAQKLNELENNRRAHIYGSGLAEFARVFREYHISVAELVEYIRALLQQPQGEADPKPARSDEILKALVLALGRWRRQGKNHLDKTPDIGALFDLGIIYLQARQKGGSKAEMIAEAAVQASPLGELPSSLYYDRIAVKALLEAFSNEGSTTFAAS